MSTCPNFDLYSVYLDQEMSESIAQTFSKHLEECTECKSNFSRLRSLHKALCSDSQSLSYSKTKMDESFNKLCVVMNYKAVTKKAQPNQIIKTLKSSPPPLLQQWFLHSLFLCAFYETLKYHRYFPLRLPQELLL